MEKYKTNHGSRNIIQNLRTKSQESDMISQIVDSGEAILLEENPTSNDIVSGNNNNNDNNNIKFNL